ncbi:MAG: hypothetical protein JGK26_27175 [Microcoleus sp. PH2017_27_LUM_O_A]|uniref:hypothetical protein n=1 Tax=unclassified Microcoleus TaxID=2642155 RepID=UPI001E00EB3A|nr:MULTISPECIES: hypothetical protein [unclassified Microcoleus]MCC3463434.1 hypothetical protein [Microcoleus sp. PH2017_11_PCY_U_A]MCC3562734.1 hypothetical protein [Microcoleus sp. PH2017_27_LUM_O_A]
MAIFQAQTQRRIPIARGYHGEDVPYKTLYIHCDNCEGLPLQHQSGILHQSPQRARVRVPASIMGFFASLSFHQLS